MDANSLYPRCRLRETTAHRQDALGTGCTQFQNLDRRFMLRYLAITVGKTGTVVDKYLPEPNGTTTLHSLVSRDTPNQFHEPKEVHNLMTETEVNQKLAGLLLRPLVLHINTITKQLEEGSTDRRMGGGRG